jgi:hypothetical protein
MRRGLLFWSASEFGSKTKRKRVVCPVKGMYGIGVGMHLNRCYPNNRIN